MSTLTAALRRITPTLVTYTGSGSGTVTNVGKITFTDAPTIRINGVFSSLYTNYYISIEALYTSSGYTELYAQMMQSGTINVNSNYISQRIEASGSTVTGARSGSLTSLAVGMASSTQPCFTDLYVFSPFDSTTSTGFQSNGTNGFDGIYLRDHVGTLSDVASYDGIVFSVTPGTISGHIQVYGFNE